MNDERHPFARFWKCALQVNLRSYSRIYRGTDHHSAPPDYASNLREACIQHKVNVVGLADHGVSTEENGLRRALEDSGIVVFPGFEVETAEKVHWVCLFPEATTATTLASHRGTLFDPDALGDGHRTTISSHQLLDRVGKLGGFCFAAHVTGDNGILKRELDNTWKDPNLHAAQIPGPPDELPPGYKSIALNENTAYKRERPVALINARDVGHPNDLGHPRATTFIKMTRPCFSSFLVAFKDPGSRVRLGGDSSEENYSRIERISFRGGYLDGATARMSEHLNVVIGGRGTGKSTFLECVRYALDVPHKGPHALQVGKQIVEENLGRAGGQIELVLRSAANHMKSYTVVRRHGEPPRVIDELGNVSRLHPSEDLLPNVEIFGQNEIHELATDREARAQLLDRFLPDVGHQRERLASVYRKLRRNGERLGDAHGQRDDIEQQVAQVPAFEERARQFRELGVEEALGQVPLLERERQLRSRLFEESERVGSAVATLEESLPDLVFVSDRALRGLPHEEMLRRGRAVLERLAKALECGISDMKRAVDEAGAELQIVNHEIESAVERASAQLEKEFAKLPEIAGKSGRDVGRDYRQLLRSIEEAKPAKQRLHTVNLLIGELDQERRNLLGEVSHLRGARTRARQKAAKDLNDRLAGRLRVTVKPSELRGRLREFLESLPEVGPRRTAWVDTAKDFTVPALVDAIGEGEQALLEREWGLTSSMANSLSRLSRAQVRSLEEVDLDDDVDIELNVSQAEERYRPLDRLSTGQRCTAVLHLLLLDNPDPLIVDQPEDNLDNAFIADRIVRELRTAKTDRQFLFATHNANIPVFGDAEWIGVCSASDGQADIPAALQGSIDMPRIRDETAHILEGGEEAFRQRRAKYGFDY